MKMRVYKVRRLKDAFPLIKKELGENAVILKTERVRAKGLKGVFGKKWLEVTAAADELLNDSQIVGLRQEINQFKQLMSHVLEKDALGSEQGSEIIDQHLISRGIQKRFAQELLEVLKSDMTSGALSDTSKVWEYLAAMMSKNIQTGNTVKTQLEPDAVLIMSFVGPTGVGKTTTIAKIAANYALIYRKKVALITLDTYRIGGYEQLKSYGELMSLPVHCAANKDEFRDAVLRNADKDLILIDTVGRSPVKTDEIVALKSLLKNVDFQVQNNLVLAANMDLDAMLLAFKSFEELGLSSLVFTKIDEAVKVGNLYNMAHQCKTEISYLTFGQNVPEDIKEADSAELVREILGESNEIGSSYNFKVVGR